MFTLKIKTINDIQDFPENRSVKSMVKKESFNVNVYLHKNSFVLDPLATSAKYPFYYPLDTKDIFTMSQRWNDQGYKPKLGAFGFVTNEEGQMLFIVKHTKGEKTKNVLYIPGGLADIQDGNKADTAVEVLVITAIREIKEETGVILEPKSTKNILFFYESIYPSNGENVNLHNMMAFFKFSFEDIKSITNTITDRDEIKSSLWIDPSKLSSYEDEYNVPWSMTYLLDIYMKQH